MRFIHQLMETEVYWTDDDKVYWTDDDKVYWTDDDSDVDEVRVEEV